MNPNVPQFSPWPHRVALALTCTTFPLIWMGGLVTSYDAGMAVPNWPGTYDHSLYSYPIVRWLTGPWDLMIEHGHRLLGSLVGLLAIALVAVVWRLDQRRWMRWMALAALLLVILQGLLGGIRVLAVDREIAKLHGCVGPAFFAYATLLAVLTSRRWFNASSQQQANRSPTTAILGGTTRLAAFTFLLSYFQLFLGANLRHVGVDADPSSYKILVFMHLTVAALVPVHAFLCWLRTKRLLNVGKRAPDQELEQQLKGHMQAMRLLPMATWLLLTSCLQIVLGLGTWVVKFGIPAFAAEWGWWSGYIPVAKSMWQANIVTAHVATGSLIIACSVALTMRCIRLMPLPEHLQLRMTSPAGVGS